MVFESGLRWQVEGSAPCSISVGRQTGSQRCSLLSAAAVVFRGGVPVIVYSVVGAGAVAPDRAACPTR